MEEKNTFFYMEKSSKKRVSLEQVTDIIGFRVILKILMTVTKH